MKLKQKKMIRYFLSLLVVMNTLLFLIMAYFHLLLAAMKERAKLAEIDDETRSNILVNKKGAMISPFFIDQINIKMAARSRTRCFCRPSHPMGRYPDLHASVP